MAFETGTASSQGDFIDKLTTFASSNGWTLDEFDDTTNNRSAVHRGNCYVQHKWDDSDAIAGYQSLGYSGGTAPGAQADDSGNGDISGAIDTDRRWSGIGNGPFTQYWLFEDDATAPYIHYVLEFQPGYYVHGSFGTIDKAGTWTGGEYHGMSRWSSGNPDSVNHNVVVDSGHNVTGECATIHAEGLPSEPDASTKWGVFVRSGTTVGTDRAAVARDRFMGGFRDGPLSRATQGVRANPSNGFIPLTPLHAYYVQSSNWRFMGKFIDIREINGFYLNPEQTLTIGSDTWHVFPAYRKATSGTHSGNLFIAYRQRA